MIKVKGQVDFSVTVECPECGHSFDATDNDDDNAVTNSLFDANHVKDAWGNLKIELTCAECDCEFELDELEY